MVAARDLYANFLQGSTLKLYEQEDEPCVAVNEPVTIPMPLPISAPRISPAGSRTIPELGATSKLSTSCDARIREPNLTVIVTVSSDSVVSVSQELSSANCMLPVNSISVFQWQGISSPTQ